jgi:hypothetical protein
MEPDVTLQHFRHQSVQCATASSHVLQHTGTLLVGVERSLDGLHLPANPVNTAQKPRLCPVSCEPFVASIFSI